MKTGINVGERGLMFIDECECDFCDKHGKCAHLNCLADNVIIVCEDCVHQLNDILHANIK